MDKISRMAVWVRILDLPVKYYRDFALKRIGGLLGPVVKIDKVTLGQTRGNFCRLCIENNLDEPLKPFLEFGDHSFGVVYEGISIICFNCGVYGHVRDHCPYEIVAQNEKNNMNTVGDNAAPVAEDIMVDTEIPISESKMGVEDSMNGVSPTIPSSNIRPWMVMSYKNKKKIFKGS